MERQHNKCAGQYCVKRYGKKDPVGMIANFDHIKPLAMNGPHVPSNIQALCLLCHGYKTRSDSVRISKWKKKNKPTKKPSKKIRTKKTIGVPGTNISINSPL